MLASKQRLSALHTAPGHCSTVPRRIPLPSAGHASLKCTSPQTRAKSHIPRATPNDEKPNKRALEDELRDPRNAIEYFLPRPLRIGFFALTSASCLIAVFLGGARLIQISTSDPLLQQGANSSTVSTDLVVNLIGCVVFAALALADKQAGERRIVQRRELRAKQIKSGDREVYLNEEGERMSKLKEVDDAWILRRLERWGRKDAMPFLGSKKGAVLQSLVEDKKPRLAVEVGTMAGYSAILIAQKLETGSKLISYEKDWPWFLAAKRFLWQASQGSSVKNVPEQRIDKKVDVRLEDAVTAFRKWSSEMPARSPQPVAAASSSTVEGGSVSATMGSSSSSSSNAPDSGHAGTLSSSDGVQRIELLFLDGVPKESLSYLQAAEPLLAPGCIVIADNAGVFSEGGMKRYLEYVRENPRYKSSYIESTLEWRDDVKDGLEVSVFLG